MTFKSIFFMQSEASILIIFSFHFQCCLSSSRVWSLMLSALARHRRQGQALSPSHQPQPGYGGAGVASYTVRAQAECQMMLSLQLQARLSLAPGDEPLLVCT